MLHILFSTISATTPDYDWFISAGGNSDDFVHSSDVDTNGNLYISGSYKDNCRFGSHRLVNPDDFGMYLAKIDRLGNWVWAIQPEGDYTGEIKGVAIDAENNIYCIGYFSGRAVFGITAITNDNDESLDSMFIAKIDTQGNWLWVKQFASHYSRFDTCLISVDKIGNVYLAGNLLSTQVFGVLTLVKENDAAETYLAKIDAEGNWLWVVKNGEFDELSCMAVDNSSNVYLAGDYVNLETNLPDTALEMLLTGLSDMLVEKYDSQGNRIWTRKFGSTGIDTIFGIAVDPDNNAYITGMTEGEVVFGDITLSTNGYKEVFVSKINSDGNPLWATRPGGDHARWGKGIKVNKTGDVYVAGFFMNSAIIGTSTLESEGYQDGFIAKLDNNGAWLWGKSIGSSYNDWCTNISIFNETDIYVSGIFCGKNSIDNITVLGVVMPDIFVFKLSDN
jgi:hypothetical protein